MVYGNGLFIQTYEPGENPEENEDEDDKQVTTLSEKDKNDAAYKSFKKQLESLMSLKFKNFIY